MKRPQFIIRSFAWILLIICSVACLKTRSEVDEADERKVIQSQMSQLQKNKADHEANLQNFEAQSRTLNGRIEALEHTVSQLNAEKEALAKRLSENDERFKQLEQAILQLEQDQPALAGKNSDESNKDQKKRTSYDEAEELFAQKQWKKAVVQYQKFRDKNPNSPDLAGATLKMGICFQEMKLIKEARVFYEEVVEKFSKSKYAKVAAARLQQLKKK